MMFCNMSSNKHLYAYIIKDRKKGMSLSDLSEKYKLAKSTVSLWCRSVAISTHARNMIKKKWLKNTAAARVKGTLKNKQKRADSIEREFRTAQSMIGALTHRDVLIIGMALYWAEGSKKEVGSGFSFINSDPEMIKIMHTWLKDVVHITSDQVVLNVCINDVHRDRQDEILKFWSNLLDCPIGCFGNTIFIKVSHRRVYANHERYFGMLRIRVKSSSWLRRRILGMIRVVVEKMPA